MKKYVLLLMALMVAWGAGHAGGEPASIEMKELGFKVQIPAAWKVNTEAAAGKNELWLDVPAGENDFITCYFKPLQGDYDKAKANIPASFRSENFASFDEMYGAEKLKINVFRKASCAKIRGLEICSGEFKYNYQQYPNQHTYYAIFKTDKGAQQAFFSTGPKIYSKNVAVFKKVMNSLSLIR